MFSSYTAGHGMFCSSGYIRTAVALLLPSKNHVEGELQTSRSRRKADVRKNRYYYVPNAIQRPAAAIGGTRTRTDYYFCDSEVQVRNKLVRSIPPPAAFARWLQNYEGP